MKRPALNPSTTVPAGEGQRLPGRLLVLSCSKAKSTHEDLIPALQRYDGPAFRVLRRYLSQRQDTELRVFILSAEFGLISSDQPVPHYDRQITSERAEALRPQVRSIFSRIVPHRSLGKLNVADLLIVASKYYLSALLDSVEPNTSMPQECVAAGSQGSKLAVLHDWLYGSPPAAIRRSNTREHPLHFRRVEFELDRAGVLEVARRELREQPARATDLHAWAVVVDGQRIAPKWLVSQATGLPVSRFSTGDALSLLARLGIEAERV